MSHGKIEKFAKMANQIGDAFASLRPEEGAQAVATHIHKFWTPKMIAETLAAIDSGEVKLRETANAGFVILRRQQATAA